MRAVWHLEFWNSLSSVRVLLGMRQPTEDRALLQRFLADRDEAAFAEIVARYGNLVFAVCRRVCRDQHDAEDAVQATFAVLSRQARAIRKQGSLASWLWGVAFRVASRIRSTRQRSRESEMTSNKSQQTSSAAIADEIAQRETLAILDQELAGLPEKFRAPLVLCYLHGRSNSEAAVDLGWPIGSMAKRLDHGRELLRRRLLARGVSVGSLALAGILSAEAATTLPSALTSVLVGQATGAATLPPIAATIAATSLAFPIAKMVAAAAVLIALAAAGAVALPIRAAVISAEPPIVAGIGDQAAPEPLLYRVQMGAPGFDALISAVMITEPIVCSAEALAKSLPIGSEVVQYAMAHAGQMELTITCETEDGGRPQPLVLQSHDSSMSDDRRYVDQPTAQSILLHVMGLNLFAENSPAPPRLDNWLTLKVGERIYYKPFESPAEMALHLDALATVVRGETAEVIANRRELIDRPGSSRFSGDAIRRIESAPVLPDHDSLRLLAIGPLCDSPDRIVRQEWSKEEPDTYIVDLTSAREEGVVLFRNYVWRPMLLIPADLRPGIHHVRVIWRTVSSADERPTGLSALVSACAATVRPVVSAKPVLVDGIECTTVGEVVWPRDAITFVMLGLRIANQSQRQWTFPYATSPQLIDSAGKELQWAGGSDRLMIVPPFVLDPGEHRTLWFRTNLSVSVDHHARQIGATDATGFFWTYSAVAPGEYRFGWNYGRVYQDFGLNDDLGVWHGNVVTEQLYVTVLKP
jgi:RNA polymerase sigma factor (sigma-70 family)